MNDQRGFTLTELLVACAILGLVLAGMMALQRQGQAAYLVGAARAEVQANARHAIETFTTELRFARAVTGVDPSCGTAGVGGTNITFQNQDGDTVVFRLAGTDLERELDGDVVVVVGGVQNFRLWCFDAADALTGLAVTTRSVRVVVGTETESGVAAYHDRNQHALLEARVRLRNVL